MLEITLLGALTAGLLSFLTPCVLPMVPFYLSYMGGLSMSELRDDGEIAPGAQRRLVLSSLFFAAGVTTVFMLLGMGATALGQLFTQYMDWFKYIAVAILVVFGLHFIGEIRFHALGVKFNFGLRIDLLYREARLESSANPKSAAGAYAMGLAFGFGWTPCIGPALATILMIAAGLGDVSDGALLLFVYGVGMTAPFVVAAMFAKPFLRMVQRHRGALAWVEKGMGVMLLLFAFLIATGAVNTIAAMMLRWFPGFLAFS